MWDKIKEHKDVFGAGFALGFVILLVLVLVFKYVYEEAMWVGPNSMDPITKSLLAYHYSTDPINSATIRNTVPPAVRKEFMDTAALPDPRTSVLVSKMWS